VKMAYVDTSCIAALALDEPGATGLRRRFVKFDVLAASNLLEAELRATLHRERVDDLGGASAVFATITWLTPHQPLSAEIATVLAAGYVRGADCWHLATALYFSPEPSDIAFLTMDERQREVAKALGFGV
jgi:predicted nucleic acid-binding protein